MSIKILHTSDWHLGKTFRATNFDLLDIQKKILDEIVSIVNAQSPQIILVAGDIFDTYNPPFEAERLFYETIAKVADANSLVVAIAGNHDSPDKLKITKPIIYGRHPIIISGNPKDYDKDYTFENQNVNVGIEDEFLKVNLKDENKTLAIKVIPYPSEVRMGVSGEDFIKNLNEIIAKEPQFSTDYFIVISHLFVGGAVKSGSERLLQVGGLDVISSNILPKNADYIALGHLHKYQKINNAVYSGSIYPFDVGEIDDDKGVCLWEEGNISFLKFQKIPKIKRLEFLSIDDAKEYSPDGENLYYLFIKSNESYSHDKINMLINVYRDRLIGWQFETTHLQQERPIVNISSLSDEELFREFYKSKNNNVEPDNDLVELFSNCLKEIRNATN